MLWRLMRPDGELQRYAHGLSNEGSPLEYHSLEAAQQDRDYLANDYGVVGLSPVPVGSHPALNSGSIPDTDLV